MNSSKKFVWRGVDHNGFKVMGEIVALNIKTAKENLENQKICLLNIKRSFGIDLPFSKNKIKKSDITEFSIELSALISSGIPLINALIILEKITRKNAMKNLIFDIRKNVESGRSLSESLEANKKYFGHLFCCLVYAGECSGTLDIVLSQLASYLGKMDSLRRKIKKSFFYPCVVLVVALGVTLSLLIFVLPQFEHLFQSVGAQLPLLTRAVISAGDMLRDDYMMILWGIFSVGFLIKTSIRYFDSVRVFLDYLWLRFPVVGGILTAAVLARCFRTFAMTLLAGLPLTDSLKMTSNIAGNYFYSKSFLRIYNQTKSGQTLNISFRDDALFSEKIIQMISIGEESGRLDEMLKRLSDYFQTKLDDQIDNLTQLLEPALMVFLCFFIGILIIAMYLPVFRLGSVI